jgi:oligopeptide/dipeptide ABC transporter ATP-binding protein
MLITHDLGVVAGVADRVLVMYAGRQVEAAGVDELFYEPRHPYAAGLLASLPRLDRRADKSSRLHRIHGQPPSLIFVPSGCAFHPRCPLAEVPGRCDQERPGLREVEPEHWSACHFAERLATTDPDEVFAT